MLGSMKYEKTLTFGRLLAYYAQNIITHRFKEDFSDDSEDDLGQGYNMDSPSDFGRFGAFALLRHVEILFC